MQKLTPQTVYVPVEDEIFVKIEEFPNYSASNFGNIMNNNTRKILKQPLCRGYKCIFFYNKERKKQKMYKVHRIIAKCFIPNPQNKPYINHIDGNKLNNFIDNLEWCDARENSIHSWKIGLRKITDMQKKKMHQGLIEKTGKKVSKFSKKMDYIESYPSIKEAAKQNNCNPSNIASCCKGINYCKTVKGFIYRFQQ